MTAPVRLAVWSGPRNLSTALMRSFENRPDTVVVDEPLYATYLARTGIEHPGRDAVLASQPTDPDTVVRGLHAPLPEGVALQYAKHMAHHLLPDDDLTWTTAFRSVLLIRDPAEVVASYVRSRESCEPADLGVLQQVRLLEQWGSPPPVIDAETSCRTPRATCGGCARGWASGSRPRCCPGRRAPGPPTGSGRRTGTTRCTPRPASSRGGHGPSNCRRTTRRSPTPVALPTDNCGSFACSCEVAQLVGRNILWRGGSVHDSVPGLVETDRLEGAP